MATPDGVEAVPEPGTDHPTGPCMGVGGDDLAATTTTEETSWSVSAETTSDLHHEAAVPEQAAEGSSTSSDKESEKVQVSVPKEKEQEQEASAEDDDGQESPRERLKRHRREMAGRVWVPDMWGQEKLLKDWVDCGVFDRPLVPPDLLTARRALVAECCVRRPDRTSPPPGSSPLRVQNGCS
ncbi:hypothetical protein ABZP36_004358 [Zizania latifolia]